MPLLLRLSGQQTSVAPQPVNSVLYALRLLELINGELETVFR